MQDSPRGAFFSTRQCPGTKTQVPLFSYLQNPTQALPARQVAFHQPSRAMYPENKNMP